MLLSADSSAGILYGILVIGGLIYIVFISPIIEKKRDNLEFDNLVIGFVDGLFLAGIAWKFRCTNSEIRNYVRAQLKKAHKLPGNQCLIEYTTENGVCYWSSTVKNDYQLFALLCVAEYGKCKGNDELVSYCESMMPDASRSGLHITY